MCWMSFVMFLIVCGATKRRNNTNTTSWLNNWTIGQHVSKLWTNTLRFALIWQDCKMCWISFVMCCLLVARANGKTTQTQRMAEKLDFAFFSNLSNEQNLSHWFRKLANTCGNQSSCVVCCLCERTAKQRTHNRTAEHVIVVLFLKVMKNITFQIDFAQSHKYVGCHSSCFRLLVLRGRTAQQHKNDECLNFVSNMFENKNTNSIQSIHSALIWQNLKNVLDVICYVL